MKGDAVLNAAWMADQEEGEVSVKDIYNFHSTATFQFNQFQRNATRFGGDLTSAYLYSAFLVAAAADNLRSLHAEGSLERLVPTRLTAQSLSDMTGIPRETVRRKCQELAATGFLRLCPSAQYELRPDLNEVRACASPFFSLTKLLR